MNGFNRWIRSKQGQTILGVVVVLVLLVAVIGYGTGLFGAAGGKKTTPVATVPEPTSTPVLAQYAAPVDGFTCLPSCKENDGKFLVLAGTGVASFAGSSVTLWVAVPGNAQTFDLAIFDGDTGKDDANKLNWQGGNWDANYVEVTYTLTADALQNGQGTTVLGTWKGNADNMPNNAWWTKTFNQAPEAKGPSGHYFYKLTATAQQGALGYSVFKVKSTGYLSAGSGDMVGGAMGFMGGMANARDVKIIYPESNGLTSLGTINNYSGDWTLFFYVPNDATRIEIWNGDMDHGTSDVVSPDGDDPNTTGLPPFPTTGIAVPERAAGKGAPNDNKADKPWYMRGDAVTYEVVDPAGSPIYTDTDPSGTEEWERFVLTTDAAATDADLVVSNIQAGVWGIRIKGLDNNNAAWFYINQQVCSGPDCGPDPHPEAFCPRTIGYWKNNVRKILIEGTTNGIQESTQSLHDALDYLAIESKLFRSGINVADPEPIAAAVRLSDQEANAILQKAAGNSMLDRALQQNLATWLNLESGKIGPYTVVTINTPNGTFTGPMIDALRTAEQIILTGDMARMEYAKDIADMINNGAVNIDPESNVDNSGVPNCSIYEQAIPKDKQRPPHDKLPKAPKPEDPIVPPAPPVDETTCTGTENQYTVENTTNNPFYSIKFNYASGTEVKAGTSDIFKYTLPQAVVAGMQSMQLEGKGGQVVTVATLTCDFTQPLSCEAVGDPTQFMFQFTGAVDNGDGTLTLTFEVWNFTEFGLSHVSFGLPDGAVPSTPTNNYSSKVCTQ